MTSNALSRSNKKQGAPLGKLFCSMLYISAFTFGGGFVIVTLMKQKFVDELHWLDEKEMLDMTALAQSAPGAIAVNAAILLGWHIGGLAGMLSAVAGTILPPMVILSVISVFYTAFAENPYVACVLTCMQAGVAAVVLNVVCDMGGKTLKSRDILSMVLLVAAFAAKVLFNVSAVEILLVAIGIGAGRALWLAGRKKRRQE